MCGFVWPVKIFEFETPNLGQFLKPSGHILFMHAFTTMCCVFKVIIHWLINLDCYQLTYFKTHCISVNFCINGRWQLGFRDNLSFISASIELEGRANKMKTFYLAEYYLE